MKIRTDGSQAFNVPNDEEGHVFLKLLRKFRNRGWYYRARGRGSREEHGDANGIEQEHSEWMAVYMSPKAGRRIPDVSPYSVRRAVARALTTSFNEHTYPSPSGSDTHPSPSAFTLLQSHPTGGGEGGDTQSGSNPYVMSREAHERWIARANASAARWSWSHPRPSNWRKCATAQPAPEDIAELTHAEQEILERVLQYMSNVELQNWDPASATTFHSLFNKLVD